MSRADHISRLEDALGKRKLVWFGIRGQDAASFMAFEQFEDCYSMTAPIGAASLKTDVSMEALTNTRLDLDTHDIDLDTRDVVRHLRRMLLASLNTDSVLCTYRPYYFVSNVHFACAETATFAGMFKERQIPFEHKPWVETSLRQAGIRTLPWRYFAEERRSDLTALLAKGPIVLRASRSSGGTGVTLARTSAQIDERWEPHADSLIAVAPYLEDAASVNVGACVFPDGTVTVHPGSYQLIGVPECTQRYFGYCGNDIGLFKRLPDDIVDEVDAVTRQIGRWLSSMGYVGAFGLDLLCQDGEVLFSEINPRFQGSTAFKTALCAELGLSDILLDHLGAFLGVEPDADTARLTLRDWNGLLPDRAQIVLHNLTETTVRLAEPMKLVLPRGSKVTTELIPLDDSVVDPGAILLRAVATEPVSVSGYELTDPFREVVATLSRAFAPVASREGVTHGAHQDIAAP